MFTGIIEATGTISKVEKDRSNVHFWIESPLSGELKVDQSVSHNGICLTVVECDKGHHRVTAVEETLHRTTARNWKPGNRVNLERCTLIGGRLDGHLVQGHVDTVTQCTAKKSKDGSWSFTFRYHPKHQHLLVDKGSVCLNGVSLTVIKPENGLFSVAIIPYTWEFTNFHELNPGDLVNVEFDIVGKYIARHMQAAR